MATETLINELKINYLTEAQFKNALNNNQLNENEIYMTPESDDEFLSSTDPVGTGSFSMNRKEGTTVGSYSIAIGYNVTASGNYSHAEGYDTTASGNYSHAEGYGTTASVGSSHAEGRNTTASGSSSHAEGDSTKASGIGSHAEGSVATASGKYSHAEGRETIASGDYSHAEGCRTEAKDSQHVQGHYNLVQTAGSASGTTGTAFIIGNGTSDIESNAFRVTYAGAAYGLSAFNASGADMAEFREWLDGNPNNEDRRGYFVTMDGMNIKIAEPGDYICGVISANPCLVGNGDENWQGRYILDEFGAYIYEEKEEIDPVTGETFINKFYKVNPDYDPTQTYVQREDRPEWDYVGLCGVINTRDDGTCEVNGFCKCGEGGIATKSERGYRVLERVNDNVVKILFFLTGEIF